jgi:hypothetical protein
MDGSHAQFPDITRSSRDYPTGGLALNPKSGGSVQFEAAQPERGGKARVRRVRAVREAVARLVSMLRTLRSSEDADFHLAPFVGVACPGVIREDGSIERGGQNLPGDWKSPDFNLVLRMRTRSMMLTC